MRQPPSEDHLAAEGEHTSFQEPDQGSEKIPRPPEQLEPGGQDSPEDEPTPDDEQQPEQEGLPFNLTERQYDVARLAHLPYRQIGELLSIETSTVKTHIKDIRMKLKASTRADVVRILGMGEEEWRRELALKNDDQPEEPALVMMVWLPPQSRSSLPKAILDLIRDYTGRSPNTP